MFFVAYHPGSNLYLLFLSLDETNAQWGRLTDSPHKFATSQKAEEIGKKCLPNGLVGEVKALPCK